MGRRVGWAGSGRTVGSGFAVRLAVNPLAQQRRRHRQTGSRGSRGAPLPGPVPEGQADTLLRFSDPWLHHLQNGEKALLPRD